MVRIAIFCFLFLAVSCVPYYKNEYNMLVPKNPNYSLKDKKGFILPHNLDTANVYKYYGYYDKEKLIPNELKDWGLYDKFCANGRVFGFGTAKLKESDLNPNFATKGYYFYDAKNKMIRYEAFVIAEGGQYVILKYRLSTNGDTLTSFISGNKGSIYIRERIPKEWKRYKVDW